ncbi:HEPN domain-containing protein [Granulicella arctica]|uniref:HEPN domain-containing protein n=1 Tax=Granulicella arctica TaxID=940613 RepID=A0A7Y9PDS7_9BACT|nr:HEPN domain-containing protein [Granulicella arctica]NYF77865.1 HEPN domain-containing protein [Granulicella arctica]
MNRSDLQRLTKTRIREAKILFTAGEYSGAYYLSGYAVECALKACFAKGVSRHDFPDKNRAGKIFIHRLPELATLANLKTELDETKKENTKFAAGWELICRWTEESRYSIWTRNDAEAILDAIVRRKDGVLPWIKQRW